MITQPAAEQPESPIRPARRNQFESIFRRSAARNDLWAVPRARGLALGLVLTAAPQLVLGQCCKSESLATLTRSLPLPVLTFVPPRHTIADPTGDFVRDRAGDFRNVL